MIRLPFPIIDAGKKMAAHRFLARKAISEMRSSKLKALFGRIQVMRMTLLPAGSLVRIFCLRFVFCVAVLLPLPNLVAQQTAQPPPTVVFMTDFGIVDDSVALCKGVMYGIAPNLRIVDLTHEVNPFSIRDGARFLFGATPYFSAGTVFVVVIDPTVGSSRKAVVVKSKRGQFFVLPDNGLMTMVEDRDGIESVREITNPAWMVGARISSTFHGRDIFSPVGAHIARGDDWSQVGPVVQQLVRLELKAATVDDKGLTGEVIALDGPFGNLVTNISADDFSKLGYQRGDKLKVTIAGREVEMPFVKTFSDVPLKQPLLYVDSRGRVSFAVNQASFAAEYKIDPPQVIFIPRKGR
jgi:S-adenosyl-L-methionine hydrolase (adenosine-forming)